MIRRTVAGVLCLVLSLLLAAGGEIYFRQSADQLLSALDSANEAEEEALFSAAAKAAAVWNSREPLLGVLLKQSDADALGKLFSLLSFYAAARDYDRCAAAFLQCRTEVLVLLEGERFSWENILLKNGKNFY